ncbi:sigma factor [Saccharopolyspora elongata]|uniref:RNA polymerase sigma-70 region 2 domain-containing protein n=1 Tax=Saccharopolyspora elongata TaxID=2530387 RepID=A0A4R4YV18_9PSEU|nr:hypothetical protein E1288_22990 [Saccharopolyspora elongata]
MRDELVTGHLPVAEHIAQRFRQRGGSYEDLVQVATVGLIHAGRVRSPRGFSRCRDRVAENELLHVQRRDQ